MKLLLILLLSAAFAVYGIFGLLDIALSTQVTTTATTVQETRRLVNSCEGDVLVATIYKDSKPVAWKVTCS